MKQIRVFLLIATMIASVLNLMTIQAATAAGESISITTTNFSPGNPGNIGIALSGFDQTKSYQATVKFVLTSTSEDVTNGTLAATQGGTSLIPGYTSFSAAKLGFKGTYAAVSAALASITWNPSAPSGPISIRIGVASVPGTNEFYDANSQHYYRYVSSGLAWTAARNAAESTQVYGLRGYLAEINSAAENDFIGKETTATNVWIGATDAAFEGTWIWDGATSTPKPVGNGTNAGPTATYQSWAGGEPNEHSSGGPSGEDCAVTNWQGAVGMWNDLPCGSAYSYLIEYGGRPSEVSTAITVTETIPINAVNPTVISVAPIGGVTVPATGATPVSTVTAANGYTGTVTWSPSGSPFAASTSYTATITLTAASAYTLTGVAANFFTVAGATSVTHSANSGIITAVFPATAISPPAFTISPISETVTVGSAISGYAITSTGGTIASYSISPAISNTPGLSFSTSTGLITGTPTAAASSATYTITATNATSTATGTFTITVNPVAPAFTISTNSISGVQGTSITGYSISSTGGPIESFSISPAISNAPGLSFSTSTGLISGTPTSPSGLRTYTVTATNAAGSTSRTFDLKVDSPPIPAVIKEPEQRSSISSISHGCPIDANIVVIKGSFLSPIGNIHINNQAISSSLWKQSASEVVITLTSSIARVLTVQIFNGQLPLLPSQSISIAASCATPTPTPKPTPTPTATPTPKPTATPTPKPTATPTPKPTATPTPKPTPTATNQQPNTQMLKVGTVYMASGTYFLNDATKETLKNLAQEINTSGAKSILIYGHADSRGGVDNTLLSQNRAKAVAKYIRPLLTSKNISIGWFSSNKPAKAGNSAAAQALNRRVEIYTK